jgi:hypothetical protein
MKHLSNAPSRRRSCAATSRASSTWSCCGRSPRIPDDRYQSADEMEADLERVARGARVAAATVRHRDAGHAPARGQRALGHGRDDDRAASRRGTRPPPPIVEEEEYEEAASGRCGRGSSRRCSSSRPSIAGFFVWQELSGSKAHDPVNNYVNEQQCNGRAADPRCAPPSVVHRAERAVQEGHRLQAGSERRHEAAQGRHGHDLGLDRAAEGDDPGREGEAVDGRAAGRS